jgi:hypothetical protein
MEAEEIPDFKDHRLKKRLWFILGAGISLSLFFCCIYVCGQVDRLHHRLLRLEHQQDAQQLLLDEATLERQFLLDRMILLQRKIQQLQAQQAQKIVREEWL